MTNKYELVKHQATFCLLQKPFTHILKDKCSFTSNENGSLKMTLCMFCFILNVMIHRAQGNPAAL